ncbi:Uncharacterised protein [Mycobacteroides abscessus subsp. abscessus]|uniref:hypothetical protein n=1 Tax=Mycobacteroides abscessus TaxID=36809 RepID=UPI00092A4106|nr:hypothetical protein [Mycobacteroides abscessus]SHT83521.1 Uncharacterised protein [Mycobacteroides abscessus subsp. abscessus]SKO52406.1 Uncharacterised protein [Mycobacteroides abscessus subsp. abscessus]
MADIKSASPEAEARFALTDALRDLTYSGAAGPVPGIGLNQSETEFLAEVTDWIGELGKALTRVRESVIDVIDELETLRSQRRSVRAFLGLNSPAEDD